MSEADAEFAQLAREYLDDRAERHPDAATGLGDHRFDARLPDPSAQARADERRALDGWAARLAALDRGALSAEHQVDAAMMADGIARRVFEIDELREHTWNPLLANPGQAIYEPFLGSGTTLIAAETSGRTCFAIELDPCYVDVAVRRWEAFTGKQATLLADGRSFEAIAAERRSAAPATATAAISSAPATNQLDEVR